MYKKLNSPFDNSAQNAVKRLTDNAHIPFDPENIDYQKYLEWVAEGNTPEPADEE